MVMSDSEDGGDSEASRKVRVKKRTVLSDDDEVDVPKPTRKPRKNARASEPVDSDAENDVKALMDVDDGGLLLVYITAPPLTIYRRRSTRNTRHPRHHQK
jgi:hypothetical protein